MAPEFVKTSGSDQLVTIQSKRLAKELTAGHHVLWIITGGSGIPAEVDTFRQLHKQGVHFANLSVALSDERYGPPGHADSNWHQLEQAGFDFDSVQAIPILNDQDASLESVVLAYEQAIQKALAHNDLVIAQLGIGADGHTAGILPSSPATAADSNDLVTGYRGTDFTRITLSPAAIEKIQVAYLLVNGAAKKSALEELRDKDLPIKQQPAQLLKALPEVYIFSDQLK